MITLMHQKDILWAAPSQASLCESRQCQQFKTATLVKVQVYDNFIT